MKFYPGDVVKCINYVEFIDGTEHKVGMLIDVTIETEAYFNTPCNNKNYALYEHCTGYKSKLLALLEGLECQNTEDLLEKPPEYLKKIGSEIAKYAKIGAMSDL